MSLPDSTIGSLLEHLRSADAEFAWREFLTTYSAVVCVVIRIFTRDADEVSDCFLYVCEKLAEKDYRRLQAFKPHGSACFSTWLRAVVRNLCLDWLRSQHGRKQPFRSIACLDSPDQVIFTAVFQRELPLEQAWLECRAKGLEIPYSEFEERATRVRKLLTSRQLWLLSTANPVSESLDCGTATPQLQEVVDLSPSPEQLLLLRDIDSKVSRSIEELEDGDRLLIRLRFFQGLGFLQIAELLGLKDAQTADRRIRDVVDKLRQKLGVPKVTAVKVKSLSV